LHSLGESIRKYQNQLQQPKFFSAHEDNKGEAFCFFLSSFKGSIKEIFDHASQSAETYSGEPMAIASNKQISIIGIASLL